MDEYTIINGLSKECLPRTVNSEKTFEDEVNENKIENVEESLEPVNVDKAGSEASEEETHGLSKIFSVLGYCIPNILRKQTFFSTIQTLWLLKILFEIKI